MLSLSEVLLLTNPLPFTPPLLLSLALERGLLSDPPRSLETVTSEREEVSTMFLTVISPHACLAAISATTLQHVQRLKVHEYAHHKKIRIFQTG